MNQRLRVSALFSLPSALLLLLSCGTAGQSDSDGGASTGSSSGAGSGASTGSGAGTGTVAGSGTASTGSGAGSGVAGTGAGGTGSAGAGSSAGSSGTAGTGATSGGSSGTAGSGASSGSGSGGPAGGNSVLQRGPDLMRRETFIQPMLTKTAAAAMTMDAAFTAGAKFTGGMAASVLYLENGPPMAGCPSTAMGCVATTRTAGNGLFFAATNGGIVYALDETSGAIVWKATVMGGGDGIRGTPVIDPATRTLYVTNGGGGQHLVHALSADDGTERQGWPVKLTNTTLTINGTAFNSVDENEHGAMMFANGIVYVPFGGHYGDGGNYHGWVVAIQASNPTMVSGWVSAGTSEGVWAHGGGMASDGTNIYVVTSNGHAGDHTLPTTDAEEVIKFSGMGTFTRNAQNVYYPTNWKYMDSADRDFGADSPSYVPLPAGSTPSAILVAPAKPGVVYFLDANNLSSGKYPAAGGELAMLTVANTTGESVYTAPTIYQSAAGLHAAIDTEIAAVCPAGGPQGDKMILSMLLQPGATFSAKTVWCATASGNAGKQYNQPPISTTTDATGSNALVWFTNGGALTAVDGDTGASVLAGTGMCTGMEKMMWPIAVKGRIVVAADGHLCAWK
jgi:hypothetical protein